MSNVTMADLVPGTRICHTGWNLNGTIRSGTICQADRVTEIRWDDVFGEVQVSDSGPVFPADLEITGRVS